MFNCHSHDALGRNREPMKRRHWSKHLHPVSADDLHLGNLTLEFMINHLKDIGTPEQELSM